MAVNGDITNSAASYYYYFIIIIIIIIIKLLEMIYLVLFVMCELSII